MRCLQTSSGSGVAVAEALSPLGEFDPDLLLVFASPARLRSDGFHATLRRTCPRAVLAGCSTAGEITADGVADDSCTFTGVRFEKSRPRYAHTIVTDMADSHAAGTRLAQQLVGADLKTVLVFGPGVDVNGSALVDGMTAVLGNDIPLTGGLAGDGAAFRETLTLGNDGIEARAVVAVGLYGDAVLCGHGSFGGWEAFGPARKVTACHGNVLDSLDGEPALAVYKRYLGDYASGLPATGLLFPFAMLGRDHNAVGLIRTILGIDEDKGSLTLAGEIDPEGYLRLMHASTDKLVDGAEAAAAAASQMLTGDAGDCLAILVSCVGRKLVMGERVDEEIEAVGDTLGKDVTLTGFYSYGEISPFAPAGACRLHNQTMTVSCIREK